jgi:Fe-S oxidoreductase
MSLPGFEHVPAYPLVFPVFWGAFGIFLLVVMRHVRVFAAAHPGGSVAFDRVPRRLWGVVQYAIVQVRMFRDRRVGVMHYALFLGSTILLIGNANAVTGGIIEAVVGWPLNGTLWALLVAIQNLVALAALAGVAYAFERRLVSRPRRLLFTRTALIILTAILAVVTTEFLALAFEAARWGDIPGAFATNALAVPLRSLDPSVTEAGFALFWWGHIAVLSAFLIYIPFNKHFHVYTSFVNVYLRKLAPRGQLPAMDLEREDQTFGVRTLADLGWKDVFDGFTCTECGRCTEACPAASTGKPLDPRALIMGIRGMAVDAERGIDLIPNSPIVRADLGRDDRLPDEARLATPIVDTAIPYDAVWDCVTCGACVEACPVLIEHVDKIVGLRRNLVLEDSRFPSELTAAFRNMEQAGNPWGLPRSTRTDWTKGLPFEVPTVADLAAAGRLGEIEVLYWVGCAAAFDERNRKVARAFATCLNAAGIRFAILGQEESCTGDPARRMGNDYVYQILAAGNVETLDRYDLRSIVTACPHCFNSIGNEYEQLGGRYEVVHHSVYLQRLLADGRLRVVDGDGDGARRSVTFHDSCYLARYNGVIAAPRDVLSAVPGIELREMERSGRSSFCCGAGGGRLWMEETRGTRINAERTRQALATGAQTVATGCPFCMTMMSDGLADAAGGTAAGGMMGGGTVSALDVAELLAGSLAPAIPDGRRLPVIQ